MRSPVGNPAKKSRHTALAQGLSCFGDRGPRVANRGQPSQLVSRMDLFGRISAFWHYLAAVVTVLFAAATSAHAILYKRDSRAALLWVGVIWLVPLLGGFLYLALGINRIRRRALFLRGGIELPPGQTASAEAGAPPVTLLPHCAGLTALPRVVGEIVPHALLGGNRVEPLLNGDEAFPAMVEAIERAERSIALSTYIFDHDTVGRRIADALERAVRRGLEVRVLVDDTGARYSFPSIVHLLHRMDVPVARFLPSLLPWRFMSINLRNHRKILVTDGRVGFTGGMNIRQGHMLKEHPRGPTQDLHFRMEGPVVEHLQQAFVDDWYFCTREALKGDRWFPPLPPAGPVVARGIADGPDEDFEIFRWTVLGALACARSSVRILTPYFLPDIAMISALNLAAMRGVEVDIILPGKSNLPYVHWATFAILWQVLQRGCRVWLTPPPFDHTKLMLVDQCWSLLGSANWDPRSLRLNFEFNVECYDPDLAASLGQIVQAKLARAQPVTLADVNNRPLPIQLRDGFMRLFTPLL
ncbi:MAG: cardiolipin synthase [Verrucomicrobiota bacterium]